MSEPKILATDNASAWAFFASPFSRFSPFLKRFRRFEQLTSKGLESAHRIRTVDRPSDAVASTFLNLKSSVPSSSPSNELCKICPCIRIEAIHPANKFGKAINLNQFARWRKKQITHFIGLCVLDVVLSLDELNGEEAAYRQHHRRGITRLVRSVDFNLSPRDFMFMSWKQKRYPNSNKCCNCSEYGADSTPGIPVNLVATPGKAGHRIVLAAVETGIFA